MSQVKFVVNFVVVAVAALTFVPGANAAPITVQSYTYNALFHVPSGSYPDNGAAPGTGISNTELIDGQFPTIGTGTAFSDSRWVGVSNITDDGQPHPEITFNLGTVYDLNSFTVIYDVDNGPQIFAPDSVSVSYSNDNILYSTPVSLLGFNDTGSQITRSTTFSFPTNAQGQFAKLQFFNDGEWTFLAEVSFDGAIPVPAPEPSSLLLLGCGALGMLQCSRRRRKA